jgi:hypothetical protein
MAINLDSAPGLRRDGGSVMNGRSIVYTLLAAVALVGAGVAPQTCLASPAPATEAVRWKNGDVELVGTLYLPKGEGPFPAAVFLHGSGTLTRGDRMYREHGERMAALGLALLVFDKRGTGDSSGDWKAVGFRELADDALGGVASLRAHKRIAADRIGLFGLSQGGWVAADILSRAPDIAFVVLISAPLSTPEEQGYYITEHALRQKGFGEADIREAVELQRKIDGVYRIDSGWEDAAKAVEGARSKPWFETAAQAGVGLQARDSWNWRWYAKLFGHDPVPALRAARGPIFAVYGEADPIVPGPRSAEALRGVAAESGRDVTTLLVPGASHDLGIRKGPQPALYWSRLEAWLRERKIVPAST